MVSSPKTEAVSSSKTWYTMGHIFKPDNEGGRLIQNYEEFEEFMTDHLHKATRTDSRLPQTQHVFTHGDDSPHNIMRLPDGRLAIFDFEFLRPTYWE